MRTVGLIWRKDLQFESTLPSGASLTFDGDLGPQPVETMVAAIGACMAMDVMSILVKKRQSVSSYRIETEYERAPEGEWPRPVLAIRMRHIVSGSNIDPQAVERAVSLSDEKYCSVLWTLRRPPTITMEWAVEPE